MTNQKNRPNVHISYEQQVYPWHQEIARLVNKYASESASLLDIGCGVGNTLAEIRKLNKSIKLFASDIDDNTLAITLNRVDLEQSIKINTVEDLFDTELTFDIIVMSHVLEHTYRPLDILKGVIKMLRPNGILILAVPNPVRLSVFLGNIFKKHYVNRGHVYAWDRSHWINFLENIAGLNVEEYSQDIFGIPIIGRFKIFRPFQIWLAKILPWLAFSNIAVIRNQ
jgi:2-polyprenyl-3-methyl-5-hydroxy-6-metoxy-1,4-benzoquinol methylase